MRHKSPLKNIVMNYNGKLYGKVGNRFFDTGLTSQDVIIKSEPIDPHTCDLCVGDVVKCCGTEGIIIEIDDNINERLRYRVFDYWNDEPINYSRDQITLKSNQRAGVQIEKV